MRKFSDTKRVITHEYTNLNTNLQIGIVILILT